MPFGTGWHDMDVTGSYLHWALNLIWGEEYFPEHFRRGWPSVVCILFISLLTAKIPEIA